MQRILDLRARVPVSTFVDLDERRYYSTNMETPANRMVALCDILGFSPLIETEPLADIIEHHLPRFLDALENSVTHNQPVEGDLSITRLPQSDKLGVAWFSDTVLLYALDDSDEACKKVIETAGWLLFRTLFGSPRTRMRIGVSYGEFYVNEQKDLFLGKVIVEAHKIERQQVWMGGALSKSAEARMRCILPSFFTGSYLTEYPVPVKGDKHSDLVGLLAIDWTQGFHDSLDMLWSSTSDEPTPSEWRKHPDICAKWSNTRRFHQDVCVRCNQRNSLREDE